MDSHDHSHDGGPGDGPGDEGASAVEYGLLVALVALLLIPLVLVLGGETDELFRTVCTGTPFAC